MKFASPFALEFALLACVGLAAPAAAIAQQEQPTRAPEQEQDSGTTGEELDFGDLGLQDLGTGDDFSGFEMLDQPVEATGTQQPAAGTQPEEELELLAFNNADISQVILTLQRLAGRPVHPDSLVLAQTIKVTVINSTPLNKTDALNLLVDALFANRIAVIDRRSHLAVVPVANLQEGMVPVLGPDEEIMHREDTGMVVEKVFQIQNGSAATIREKLQAQGPPNMKIEVEEDTNQIIALYNIGTLQRLQEQINQLDIVGGNLQLETFYLDYADADTIARLIVGLFGEEDDQSRGGNQNPFANRGRQQQPTEGLQTSQDLTVVTNKTQNSVSVRAERNIIESVRAQIETWDVPVAPIAPVVRSLQNSDAVKMAEMLNALFALDQDTVSTITNDFFFGGGGNQQQRNNAQASGDEPPKISPLAGQVSFFSDRSKNTLIIQARSANYYPEIEKFIDMLDQPSDANLPVKYELKHAEADDLATRLNALLAEEGRRVDVARIDTGLNEQAINPILGSDGDTGDPNAQENQTESLQFPWMSGSPDEEARLASTLIGQTRIMPIPSQNALLVVAPPELKTPMATLIHMLDIPARQVLIQAIVAEVSLDDETSLGIRWGSGTIGDGPNADNKIVIGSTTTGTKNELINALFDTSTLGVDMDLNVALQALSEITNVDVLFRPKVVTSSNEEAHFFDGQDIPFITDSTTTDVGGVTQSFDYLAVGIQLSVRPHITQEGNIDLRVNLKLSSVVPGQTLFGGSILDRRETSTKVTILDGQTVVISGIRRTALNDIVRKVPILGDIPLIGGIFRSTEKSESRTELVAFIRPIVLDTPEKIRSATMGDFETLNRARRDLEHIDTDAYPATFDDYRDPSERFYDPIEPATEDNGDDDDDDHTNSADPIWWNNGSDESAAQPARTNTKSALATREDESLPWLKAKPTQPPR